MGVKNMTVINIKNMIWSATIVMGGTFLLILNHFNAMAYYNCLNILPIKNFQNINNIMKSFKNNYLQQFFLNNLIYISWYDRYLQTKDVFP